MLYLTHYVLCQNNGILNFLFYFDEVVIKPCKCLFVTNVIIFVKQNRQRSHFASRLSQYYSIYLKVANICHYEQVTTQDKYISVYYFQCLNLRLPVTVRTIILT